MSATAAPNSTTGPVAPTVSKSHPKGLYLLFVVEMWERFSYYGMKAILILYLVQNVLTTPDANGLVNPGRGWSKADAALLLGLYAGLAYLMPMVGGIIADKFIGTHRSMLVGGITIALGHIVLAVSGMGGMASSDLGMSVFVFGLALIIMGTGHFKPCVSVMVGQLYPQHDSRRDGAFTIFYMGINLGAFLAPLACGYLGQRVGWHYGFGAAAVGMILGLIIYQLGRPTLLKGIGLPPENGKNIMVPLFLIAIAISAAAAAIFHFGGFGAMQKLQEAIISDPVGKIAVPVVLTLVTGGLIGWFVSIQEKQDRGPVFAILAAIIFNAFFWLAFEQAGGTLNLFADEKTNLKLLGMNIPSSFFQSVNPFFIFTCAPLFAILWVWLGKRNLNPSQFGKIGWGLLLLGLGYIIITMGGVAAKDGAKVSALFLLGTYFLHTMGELCLSPTGLSFCTKVAPVKFVSFIMGIWFLSSFVANLGAGIVGSQIEKIEKGEVSLPWHFGGQADFFMLFVVSSIAAAIVAFAVTPFMKKLLHGRE